MHKSHRGEALLRWSLPGIRVLIVSVMCRDQFHLHVSPFPRRACSVSCRATAPDTVRTVYASQSPLIEIGVDAVSRSFPGKAQPSTTGPTNCSERNLAGEKIMFPFPSIYFLHLHNSEKNCKIILITWGIWTRSTLISYFPHKWSPAWEIWLFISGSV